MKRSALAIPALLALSARDEFRAFPETNKPFTIHLPETFKDERAWAASGCNRIVRWRKDPNRMPPSVMTLR